MKGQTLEKKKETHSDLIGQVLQIARSKVGETEQGGQNQGPIVSWSMHLFTKVAPDIWAEWCAAFVCTVFLEAGSTLIRQLASTSVITLWKHSLKAGVAWQRDSLRPPQPGDMIFFAQHATLYHVGLVETVDEENQLLTTIEGNSDDAVRQHQYAFSHQTIYGFARIPA